MGTAWCICLAIMTLTQSGGQDEDVPRRIIRQYPLQMTKLYMRPGKRNGKGALLVHKETPPWISLSIFKRHRLCILFCLGLIVRNTNTAHCRFCPIVRALDCILNALFGASLDRRYFDLKATRAEFLESLRAAFSWVVKMPHFISYIFLIIFNLKLGN